MLRPEWVSRSDGACEFYTLGRCCYLDLSPSNADQYLTAATRSNASLWREFEYEYEVLRNRLMDLLGLECRFDRRLALPGFHIWLGDAVPTDVGASPHYDLQYQLLVQAGLYDSPFSVGSFTVPVSLPDSPYHIKFWDIEYDPRLPLDLGQGVKGTTVKYTPGRVYAALRASSTPGREPVQR